jgi:hypothetical protein
MNDATDEIGVHCTPVPDGVTEGGNLRLSLVLTPDVRPGQELTGLTLQDWPKAISSFANKHLIVCFSGKDGDGEPFTAPLASNDAVFTGSDGATTLWKKLFLPDGLSYNGLDYLFKALQQNTLPENELKERSDALDHIKSVLAVPREQRLGTPLVDEIGRHTVTIGNLSIAAASVNWVPTQYLDAALNAFHDDSHLVTILALLAAQEQRLRGTTSASRLLSAMAGGAGLRPNAVLADTLIDIFGGTADHAINWINAIAAAFANRPFGQRIFASVKDAVLRALLQSGLGNPGGDAFGQLQSLRRGHPQEPADRAERRKKDIEDMLNYALVPTAKLSFARPRSDGIAMMRTLFKEAVRQHTGGRSAPPVHLDEHRAAAGDGFDKYHQHWRNNTRSIQPCEQQEESRREEAARRKFFGIRALPSLAKFLRLTVDVELPYTKLYKADLTDFYDIVAAVFVDSDDPAQWQARLAGAAWTGFDAKIDKRALLFRPASFQTHRLGKGAPELKAAPPIEDGVVNLRAAAGGGPRFMITTLDLAAAVGSMRVKAEQDSGAHRDGTMLDSIPSKMTERQSRGLQLIDSHAPASIVSDVVTSWRNGRTKAAAGGKDKPYFAEHLTIGYRAYVQRYRHDVGSKGEPVWRSLVARSIQIEQIASVAASPAYRALQARDHGYVRLAHKIQGQADSASNTPTTDGQLFAWMGSSLALSKQMDGSTSYADGAGPGQSAEDDLALDVEYGFLRGADALQPALRVGDSYMMGLSPVYPNCGGPTLAEAKEAFSAHAVTLGDAANKPFVFGPPRDIPPPGLLISDAEAKLWQKTEGAKGSERGNAENIVRVVLRSATVKPQDNKDNVKRYLVPPRGTFEVAEQSGMFDRVFEATPKGAFNDYEQDPTVGGFTSDDPHHPQKTPPPQNQRSRSPVLRPIGNAPPKAPYYPDPLARNVRVAFERDGATPAGFPEAVPVKEFWKRGASPITAKPIELLVKRWSAASAGGQIDFTNTAARLEGASSRVLDRLTVEIAPAEEVNLQFWCVPDRNDLLRSNAVLSAHFQTAANALIPHLLSEQALQSPSSTGTQKPASRNPNGDNGPDALASAVGLMAKGLATEVLSANPQFASVANLLPTVDSAFATVFSALTSQTPENGVNAWVTVKVIHAVEKPLAIPAIPCNENSRDPNKLAIQVVKVAQNTGWPQYSSDVTNYIQPSDGSTVKPISPSDPASVFALQNQDNGATGYFVGQIAINRASTGEVRVEASWPETDPASAIQLAKQPNGSTANPPRKYRLAPPQQDRALFSIKVPRDGGLNPAGQLDLTYDETGALRGLNYPFTDTIARRINFRLVATSRFAGDFPAAPKPKGPSDPNALGRFEAESRPPICSDRLKRAPAETYQEYTIIVPATAPPPTPVVSRLEWVMPETLTDFDPGRRVFVEKNFYPRLYIGQDWCGTDDLVAVICAPEDLVSDRPYSRAAPPPLQPIPLSAEEALHAPKHRAIPASAFENNPVTGDQGPYYPIAEDVSRWGSDPTTTSGALTGTITRDRFSGFVATKPKMVLPGKNSAKVSLLLYRPIFDECAGEFYIDIGIDPGPAHSPVVRLVVARYQPHVTKPEFHLSAVARLKRFQIAPKRTVEVTMLDERNVTAIVRGVGYTGRLPEIPASLKPANATKTPSLPDEYASKIKYPLQNIRVVRIDDDPATTGLQVHDESGRALFIRRVEPQFDHPELIWIAQFNLPTSRKKGHYGLHFEEIDLHFADEAYEMGQHADKHLIDRLSNFSLTIDLERGLYSQGGKDTQISSAG